jgi:hypothetical protein
VPTRFNRRDLRPARNSIKVDVPIRLARLIARLFRPVPDPERAQPAILEEVKGDVDDELWSATPERRVAFEAIEALPLEHSAVYPMGQFAFGFFSSSSGQLDLTENGQGGNPGGLERFEDS